MSDTEKKVEAIDDELLSEASGGKLTPTVNTTCPNCHATMKVKYRKSYVGNVPASVTCPKCGYSKTFA